MHRTKVGVGLVMIPFPPPIGELLVIGGASVLASEFEAPKRVMRKARQALQNAVVEDHKNDDDEEERLRRMDSTAAGSWNTDSIENKNAVSSTMPNTTNKKNNEETERDTITSTTNEQKEKVVLRDSFFSVMSQHHGEGSNNDDDDTTDDSAVPVYYSQQTTSSTISDCWSEDASTTIDPNINNMYSGKEHEEPSPTKQFLKTVGRKIILPFLDHVVGDDNDTTAPTTVVSSPAAPTNVTTSSVDNGSDAGGDEESEDAATNATTANNAPATMQAAIDPTAVSFDTENEATADSDPRTDPNIVLDILLS